MRVRLAWSRPPRAADAARHDRPRQIYAGRDELPADHDIGEGPGRRNPARAAAAGGLPAPAHRQHGAASRARSRHLLAKRRGPAPLHAQGVETHGELHGPLSEALAPRAHGPPGHARIESSGSLKDLDPQPGQDRRADRGSAVTPAPQDEVRQQGVADLAGRTPNAPHEDPMDPAGLAYQARVAAVEGHR